MTVRHTLGLLAVSLAVGVAVGLIVATMTRPSEKDLQRAALDEIGLSEDLVDSPLIGPFSTTSPPGSPSG